MSLYRDRAVVLRTHKLGEADRIITILARDNGVIRAVAKGVRKTSSRFGGRLEPFMHVDLQLAHGRSLDVITQVQTLDAFTRKIGVDYAIYTCGTAMVETAEKLVHDSGESAVQQYLLLVAALRALSDGDRPARLLVDSYQLRAMAIAGYAPTFADCANCGAAGPHRNFLASAGGILCDRCTVPGSANPKPLTVTLLGALLAGDWEVCEESSTHERREASALVTAYVAWHLERTLRSIRHIEAGDMT